MNRFEHAAATYRRKRNPSWEHKVETYLSQKVDWVLVICGLTMLAVGLGGLMAL